MLPAFEIKWKKIAEHLSSFVLILYGLRSLIKFPLAKEELNSSNFSMASITTQKPSSSSSSSFTTEKGCTYDVFMSFRGEDTRKTFSGHLYEALKRQGIHTFIDDEKLESGGEISVELLKAIEESMISVVVLSEGYASSTWCLRELVEILDCWRTKGQRVVPIFYNVNPSDVRKHKGSFGRALAKHEADGKIPIDDVQGWKKALTEVAGLSGYDLRNYADGSEAKLIQHIVGFISRKLNWDHTSLSVTEHSIGIDSRGEEVISLLGLGGTSDDVRIIGIWGVGGIGKTTIAKGVYNQIISQFEGATFLENVRECSKSPDGLLHLQRTLLSEILRDSTVININNIDRGLSVIKKRLSNKRVLVILDDVEHGKQLEKLVGDPNWFGSGSRIIITTRDEGLLKARYGVNYKTYHVKKLNDVEALQLFSWSAFNEVHPKCGFLELSMEVVKYAGGLPLALKVLGSFLRERSTNEWISELDKLQRIPNIEIQEILKVSFDGLDRMQKDIFLDVAFFFKGKNINYATKMLQSSYDFDPTIVLKVLTERSLITKTSNNALGMHDLLQEMGWEIVCQESPEEPGKRSRLSYHKDVYRVLTKNTGTEAVKGIVINFLKQEEVPFNVEAFPRMNTLKLLEVCHGHYCIGFEYFFKKEGHFDHEKFSRMNEPTVPKHYNTHPSEDFNHLSNELRCLRWPSYPLKSMPSTFHPTDLVELDLHCSRIEQLWKTKTSTLEKLEYLNLSHSQYLTETPDLSAFPRLEVLILEGCTRLVEVHPSSLVLKRLVFLSLKDCKSLRRLWGRIEMKSLETLILSGCSKLENLPEIRGTVENLSRVYLDGTDMKEVPLLIEHLTRLVVLNLANCKNIVSLPSSIYNLKSLEDLILSGCSKVENLQEVLGAMEHLLNLNLSGTGIKELPSSIDQLLPALVYLNLANCKKLATLPSSIHKLKFLRTLNVSGCSKLHELPEKLGELQNLEALHLDGSAVREIPTSIIRFEKLQTLSLGGCKDACPFSLLSPSSLSGLSSLVTLNLSDCNLSDGAIPGAIVYLSLLRHLNLSRNNFVSPPEGLNRLNRLKYIKFVDCTRLQELPLLPTSIRKINAHGCRSLEKLPHPSYLENLGYPDVYFSNCEKLNSCIYLERMHQVPSFKHKDFEFVVTGSEIPEWFKHKSTGSSISFKMSPLEFSKFKAVGFCAVYTFMAEPIPVELRYYLSDVNGRMWGGCFTIISKKRYTESDHVWLTCYRRNELVNPKVSQVSSDGSYPFEASFEAEFIQKPCWDPVSTQPYLLQIKKCGAHIFYWEDELESSEIEEKEFDDFDYPTDFSSLDSVVEEEEEPSGSGSGWSNIWLSLLKFFCPCFNFEN